MDWKQTGSPIQTPMLTSPYRVTMLFSNDTRFAMICWKHGGFFLLLSVFTMFCALFMTQEAILKPEKVSLHSTMAFFFHLISYLP